MLQLILAPSSFYMKSSGQWSSITPTLPCTILYLVPGSCVLDGIPHNPTVRDARYNIMRSGEQGALPRLVPSRNHPHRIMAVTGYEYDTRINVKFATHHRLQPSVVRICGEHLRWCCLLYTSPSPRDATLSRMPSSA